MKLIGYKKIEGIIEVVTGLHVGGSTTIIEIGGRDNPIIKHPITNEPYIPGSSIKGKMRSLLEWKLGKLQTNSKEKGFGDVHQCKKPDCPICTIFGASADESTLGPTRIIVRDAVLDNDYKESLKKKNPSWTPIDLSEDKYENTINRITARANPRNFERVVSGAQFSFKISYRVFEKDGNTGLNDEDMFCNVIDALRLVENDTLGGAGSRGCGQVKFKIKVNDNENPKSINDVTTADFPTL
ncbi:MAG: type III-A CRISPR-associated RAMP protein Csm3 [Candidatus Anammoxibacter sp.]